MPKVALRPIDAFESTIRRNYSKVKGGRTYAEIGKVIGRTAKTACTRYHDPLSMTLAELFLLCRHEQLSPADFVGGELRLQGVNHDGKFNEKY